MTIASPGTPPLAALGDQLRALGRVTVAVSGGVDSMTLAAVAHQTLGEQATMVHAVSPAVPPEATARVRRHGAASGWALREIDAGEFQDPRYRANPVNRCFFCKTNLYAAMAAVAVGQLISGTNCDDLGDYRPGLQAAAHHHVRHPYVDAGIDKAGVRAIARHLGLTDLAELPAAPCLSSRVETGIAIEAAPLAAIDQVEQRLRQDLTPHTVRCRLRRGQIAVELDSATLATLGESQRSIYGQWIAQRFAAAGVERPVTFEPYRRGSAFVGVKVP
ncbi:MAG: adenine nucleotide alpha hydrolase [Candidatus Competibacterales bacterium]